MARARARAAVATDEQEADQAIGVRKYALARKAEGR